MVIAFLKPGACFSPALAQAIEPSALQMWDQQKLHAL